jgi:hypothetical protein
VPRPATGRQTVDVSGAGIVEQIADILEIAEDSEGVNRRPTGILGCPSNLFKLYRIIGQPLGHDVVDMETLTSRSSIVYAHFLSNR